MSLLELNGKYIRCSNVAIALSGLSLPVTNSYFPASAEISLCDQIPLLSLRTLFHDLYPTFRNWSF